MKLLKSTWENGKISCQLCGKKEDERAIQEQADLNVCVSCEGLYEDEELNQFIKENKNG